MKRKSLKFMSCAAVMALMLSVTACGGSKDGASSSASDSSTVEDTSNTEDVAAPEVEDDVETEADTETDAAEEADAGDEDSFATLEEAFAEPGVKEAMDEQFSSLDMEGMEFSYEVKGNDFILTYKVIDTVIDDPDDFAEQMEPVMEQLSVVFSSVAEMFDEALEQEGATTVVVRYLDANGTLLIEHSYKAE